MSTLIVWEAFGSMMNNVGLFGMGLLVAVLAVIAGITRGMSDEPSQWGLIFSVTSWLIAFTLPHVIFGSILFLIGALGFYFAYEPLLKKVEISNIFIMSKITLAVFLTLSFGLIMHDATMGYAPNEEKLLSGMDEFYSWSTNWRSANEVGTGLCAPNDQACTNELEGGFINTLIYDIIGGILNLAGYVSKAIKYASYVVLAPTIIGGRIVSFIVNPFISTIIYLFTFLWNIAILYNVIKFVLNKRGM